MIEYRKGDLFSCTDTKAFAHGVNCMGVMGKGIAVDFKKRYPSMFNSYKKNCSPSMIGRCYTWLSSDDEEIVFNLFIKQHWAALSQPEWISSSMKEMFEANVWEKRPIIAMPKIGCGLGGLNWEKDVEPIVRVLSDKYNVKIIVYEK